MDDPRTPMDLDLWLLHATDGLTQESKDRVRAEITAHYQDALAAARETGQSEAEAQQREALAALGDPHLACKRFRQAYLWDEDEKRLAQMKKAYRTPKQMTLKLLTWVMTGTVIGGVFLYFKIADPFFAVFYSSAMGMIEFYLSLRSYYFLTALETKCERRFKRPILIFWVAAFIPLAIICHFCLSSRIPTLPHDMTMILQLTDVLIQTSLIALCVLLIRRHYYVYLLLMRKLLEKAREAQEASQEGPDQYA